MASFCTKATRPSISSAAMATHSASSAMPALPGAQNSLWQSGEAAMVQHNACPRPPPPTTRTFMPPQPSYRLHKLQAAPLSAFPCPTACLYHIRQPPSTTFTTLTQPPAPPLPPPDPSPDPP